MINYIICHDYDVALSSSANFIGLDKYPHQVNWIYVGNKDFPDDRCPLLVARNLPDNIEDKWFLVAFTAWYALVKNNLIKDHEYYGLFEYDCIISSDYYEKVLPYVSDKSIVGFIPFPIDHVLFHPMGTQLFDYSLRSVYGIDIADIVRKEVVLGRRLWNSTTNCVLKGVHLRHFVEWFIPLIPKFGNNPQAGHVHERALRIWMALNNIKPVYIPDTLEHIQCKSHKIEADLI